MFAVIPVPTPAGVEPAFDLAGYYPLLIYAGVVLAMAAGIVAASHVPILKPRHKTRVKMMPYESGMDPVGDARIQFDVKFYLIAILFLEFDVELLFLYPWKANPYVETVAEIVVPALWDAGLQVGSAMRNVRGIAAEAAAAIVAKLTGSAPADRAVNDALDAVLKR